MTRTHARPPQTMGPSFSLTLCMATQSHFCSTLHHWPQHVKNQTTARVPFHDEVAAPSLTAADKSASIMITPAGFLTLALICIAHRHFQLRGQGTMQAAIGESALGWVGMPPPSRSPAAWD